MSGHAGFMAIGGNNPRPNNIIDNDDIIGNNIFVEDDVDAGMGEAGVDAPEAQEEANAPGPAFMKTSQLVKELDVLLTKAGNTVAQDIDAAALGATATKAKLKAADARRLREAAGGANAAMRALDSLTGADITKAMKRGAAVMKGDWEGEMEWDESNPAGAAIREALDAQQYLSGALAKALNNLPKKATAEQQAALEEAMLQCDRRVCELETLVLQIAEVAEQADGEAMDPEIKARLERKVVDLAGETALAMHDRDRAVESVKAQLDPLVRRIEGYAAVPLAKLPKAHLTAMQRELDEAKNALALAAKTGKVAWRNEAGRVFSVQIDRTFLDRAAQLVAEARKRLGDIRSSVAREAVRRFVENDVAWLKDEIFAKKEYAAVFARMNPQFEKIGTVVTKMLALKEAMLACAANPTKDNIAAMRRLSDAFTFEETQIGVNLLDAFASAESRIPADAPAGFKRAHAAFAKRMRENEDFGEAISRQIDRFYNLDAAAEHVAQMCKNASRMKEEDFLASGVLRGVFRGERTLMSLVESRVHGYDDGDVNAALDDRNIESVKTLGAGQNNSVDLVTFKDGSEWVFKPELDARISAEYSPLLRGFEKPRQMTNNNIAVNKTADALGLGDVMVRTTAGTCKGRFGMFMEKALGEDGERIRFGKDQARVENGVKKSLHSGDIRKLGDAEFGKVAGRMMRKLNRLQWLDIITGQGDRHEGNYIVDVDLNLNVSLKGIDNDASYGQWRPGLFKYSVPQGRFNTEVKELARKYGVTAEEMDNLIRRDPAVTVAKDGRLTMDATKNPQPLTTFMFCRQGPGAYICAVPREMDRDLYDQLMTLKRGPKRDAYLKDLAARIGGTSSPSYKQAVARLDETIAYAERLQREGKVYSAEQWETKEVQKSIAKTDGLLDGAPEAFGKVPQANRDALELKIRLNDLKLDNYFFRDFAHRFGHKHYFA